MAKGRDKRKTENKHSRPPTRERWTVHRFQTTASLPNATVHFTRFRIYYTGPRPAYIQDHSIANIHRRAAYESRLSIRDTDYGPSDAHAPSRTATP